MNRKGLVQMEFRGNSFFYKSKKIKVSTVCFEKKVQSVNDLTIPSPVGIDIDGSTGRLNAKAHIEILSKPVLTANLENNVLIVEGLLNVRILFENPKSCPCTDEPKTICQEAVIPIQAVIPIDDANGCIRKPCGFDGIDAFAIETNAKVISTSIFGFPDKNNVASGKQISLILKAVLEITVYILKDELIDLSCCYHCTRN
jgi:hypothetical protein